MSTISHRATAAQSYDSLTGLQDRQSLLTGLPGLLGKSKAGDVGALLLMDMSGFRVINDLHGHEVGDEVLREVSRGLRLWADRRFILARSGGDEFAIALTVGPDEDIRALACQARDAASAACTLASPQFSIGIATFTCERPPAATELLKCAGNALSEAKLDGAGWTTQYDIDACWGIDGAEWILRAVAEDRLIVDAQPIVDLASGEAVRHELLVRALGDDGHVLAPGAFIPTAERFGLAPLIDRWVTSHGLALAAQGRPVSINLSAQSTTAPRPLVSMVESAIARGLRPTDLMFEVTETAAIGSSGVGHRALRTLSDLGCPLALDDFGVGYGCFSYLKHIPAQVVKIDREFIGNFRHDRTNLAVTMAVAHLARELGMETVAEGVEDEETLSLVSAAGVGYAQGYLLGRPAPIVPSAPRLP